MTAFGEYVPGVRGTDGTYWSLRMKDLAEATGLQRQAVHFYIREGLLPAGVKSSANMAWYGQQHLERLKLIRRLQHERLLPLKAIKAALGVGNDLVPSQQSFIREVKRHIDGPLRAAKPVKTALNAVLERTKTTHEDAIELCELDVIAITYNDALESEIPVADEWALEIVGELRALGFTEHAGFRIEDLAIYLDAVTEIFARETELVEKHLSNFKPDVAARMVQRMMPLVHQFIERFHETLIRRFFAASEKS